MMYVGGDVMDISGNIRKYREINHMDQADLAKLLNVSNKTVSSWECGRTEPRMGMIEAMCKIFHIEKTELIDGASEHTTGGLTLSYVETEIVRSYRKAPEGIQDSVLKLLDIEKRDIFGESSEVG